MTATNATAQYRELGGELRKRREAAGLSAVEFSNRIGWSQMKTHRIEAGYTELDAVEVIYYLGECGIYRGQALDVMKLCHEAERKTGYWLAPHGERLTESFRSLIFHEATADRASIYEPHLVHGLLQTADYARARISADRWRSPDSVDHWVDIRMNRQHVLYREDASPLTFFLHENALRQQVGSATIMHEQLLNLVLVTAMSQITVRVIPSAAGDPWSFGEPFQLFEYDEHKPLVYLEHQAAGLFLEDPDHVKTYQQVIPAIAEVALDGGQSREMIAALASEYNPGSERDADGRLEEEQL